MKFQDCIGIPILILGLAGSGQRAIAVEMTAATNAPTGLYVAVLNAERFTVDLKTNGVYRVEVAGIRTNSQTGVWKWDEERRQFSLTSNTNSTAFPYRLRVLRVDRREPDTLQWIPALGTGTVAGAIDYIRFRRKRE